MYKVIHVYIYRCCCYNWNAGMYIQETTCNPLITVMSGLKSLLVKFVM